MRPVMILRGFSAARRAFVLCGLAFALCAPALSPRADEGGEAGARAFVTALIERALEILRDETGGAEGRAEGLRGLFDEYFDLPSITRLAIGRYWRGASEEQRRAFAEAFEEHVVGIYTGRLAAYGGEDVALRKAVARTGRDTIVTTEVRRKNAPPLRIEWLVRRGAADDGDDAEYRVIDVAAEGVSMLTTKRSEFAAVIAREGLDGLIVLLEGLNAAPATP